MILDLCRWLRAQGHRVTVATCREGWLADHLRDARFETHVIPKRPRFDFRMIGSIVRLGREHRVDLFHAHEFPMISNLAVAARLNGFPLVATVHGSEIVSAKLRRRILLGIAARASRRVVAVSHAIERFLVDVVRVPRRKVQTILNGIDVDRYGNGRGRSGLRDSLGIPATARVIGTVGSLYPVKGHRFLLQSLARLVARFPDTVCLIAGRGELLDDLTREAADLHLTERVRFLGYRTDVADLLDAMDVFVLPSLSEGLPLALLEAQAAGKPVVASRVGGNPEALEDGAAGYLVPPAAPEALADRIAALLEDPARAKLMGERGRSRVRDLFGLEAMGRRYLSLYRACVNGRSVHEGILAS
jgi:glycosyltransferase involved in cell wall biosynthesis